MRSDCSIHVGAHRREYLIEMFLLRKFRFTSVSVASRALGAMVRESVLAQVPLT